MNVPMDALGTRETSLVNDSLTPGEVIEARLVGMRNEAMILTNRRILVVKPKARYAAVSSYPKGTVVVSNYGVSLIVRIPAAGLPAEGPAINDPNAIAVHRKRNNEVTAFVGKATT